MTSSVFLRNLYYVLGKELSQKIWLNIYLFNQTRLDAITTVRELSLKRKQKNEQYPHRLDTHINILLFN